MPNSNGEKIIPSFNLLSIRTYKPTIFLKFSPNQNKLHFSSIVHCLGEFLRLFRQNRSFLHERIIAHAL